MQGEARRFAAEFRIEEALSALGRPTLVGSAFTGLMVWRDLDYVVDSPECSSEAAWEALSPLVKRADRLHYADERGKRVAETAPYGRHYFVLRLAGWKLDVSVWTEGSPPDLEAAQRRVRDRLDPDTTLTILRLKDVWYRQAAYPEIVGGFEIYEAVLEHRVRSLEDLDQYLAKRGLPTRVV